MGTLKLVVNNTVTNEAEIAGEFVKDNAPALAEDVFLFILGRISYDALKTACQTQLANWWSLGYPAARQTINTNPFTGICCFWSNPDVKMNSLVTAISTSASKNALVI